MILFYVLIVSSKITNLLKKNIPEFAAYFTDAMWKYVYTSDADIIYENMRNYDGINIVTWDGSGLKFGNLFENAKSISDKLTTIYLVRDSSNPLILMKSGIRPDIVMSIFLDDNEIINIYKNLIQNIKLSEKKEKSEYEFESNMTDYKVDFDEIFFLESRQKKVWLCLERAEYELNKKMEDVMVDFPGNFKKCHRSYIINMNHIKKIDYDDNSILLENDMRIPMSRKYRNELRNL